MIKINWAYIAITLISLVLAAVFGGSFFFCTFFTLIFLFIISIFFIYIYKAYIGAEVKYEDKIYHAGDTINVTIVVKYDLYIPVPYIYVDSNYIKQVVNLSSDENRWIIKDIHFCTRGVYDLGNITLQVKDIFNISEARIICGENIKVKVFPNIFDINKFSGGGRDIFRNVADINGNVEDQFSIKDVRKYRQGDSLKRIHWKLSAKYGELFVKNTEYISGEETSILVNMNKENYLFDDTGEIEEKIADTTISLINYMRKKEVECKVYINAANIATFNVDCREEFDKLIEFLVIQKSDGDTEFVQFIQENCCRVSKANKIIIVTSLLDINLVDNLIALQKTGYNFMVFFSVGEVSGEEALKLKLWGIECRCIK